MTHFIVILLGKSEINDLKKTDELEPGNFAFIFKFKFFVLY